MNELAFDMKQKYKEFDITPLNYDKYYEHLRMISTSVKWIRQGYNQEDLPSVIPGYLQYGDVTKL